MKKINKSKKQRVIKLQPLHLEQLESVAGGPEDPVCPACFFKA